MSFDPNITISHTKISNDKLPSFSDKSTELFFELTQSGENELLIKIATFLHYKDIKCLATTHSKLFASIYKIEKEAFPSRKKISSYNKKEWISKKCDPSVFIDIFTRKKQITVEQIRDIGGFKKIEGFLNKSPTFKEMVEDAYNKYFDSLQEEEMVKWIKGLEEGEKKLLQKVQLSFFENKNINFILSQLPNLQELILTEHDELKASAFYGLSLPNLTSLDLCCCCEIETDVFNEIVHTALEKSPKVQSLNLSLNKSITSAAFDNLSLPRLKKLDVGHCELNTADFQKILKKIPNIEDLNIGLNQIGSSAFHELSFPQLTKLNIGYCDVTDETLHTVFGKIPNLKDLNLVCNRRFTHAAFEEFIFFNVKKLNLSKCHLTDRTLNAILTKFPNVEELILIENKQLTTAAFEDLYLVKLKKLVLRTCNFKGDIFKTIFATMPNIEELILDQNENLSSPTSRGCELSNVKKLDLSRCNLKDATLNEILKLVPNVEELRLSWEKSITISAFTHHSLPALKMIMLWTMDLANAISLKFPHANIYPTLRKKR